MKLYVLHVVNESLDYGTLETKDYASFDRNELEEKERWLWKNYPNARISKYMYEGALVSCTWEEVKDQYEAQVYRRV